MAQSKNMQVTLQVVFSLGGPVTEHSRGYKVSRAVSYIGEFSRHKLLLHEGLAWGSSYISAILKTLDALEAFFLACSQFTRNKNPFCVPKKPPPFKA
mmetsp:Transcript_26987/g.43461  ORF Transcript_26987/g.43461 Transcript_26987/m.43461 type:complete len:97 (+) Transcript_26987:417-707(+)